MCMVGDYYKAQIDPAAPLRSAERRHGNHDEPRRHSTPRAASAPHSVYGSSAPRTKRPERGRGAATRRKPWRRFNRPSLSAGRRNAQGTGRHCTCARSSQWRELAASGATSRSSASAAPGAPLTRTPE